MTTKDFVKKYKELNSKENIVNLINNRIKTDYIPYVQKVNVCEIIVNATNKVKNKINDDKNEYIFKDNSPLRKLLYNLYIISLYTDIEIDFQNPSDEFDLLDENDLFDMIFNAIKPNEIHKFDMILEMVVNDMYNNERNIVTYSEKRDKNKFDIINTVLDLLLEKSGVDNNTKEKIANIINL